MYVSVNLLYGIRVSKSIFINFPICLISAPICGVSWSPRGGQLFSADKDRTLCMWTGGLR